MDEIMLKALARIFCRFGGRNLSELYKPTLFTKDNDAEEIDARLKAIEIELDIKARRYLNADH